EAEPVFRRLLKNHKSRTRVMIAMRHISKPKPNVNLNPFPLLERGSIPLKTNTAPTSNIVNDVIKGKSIFQRIKLIMAKTVAVNANIISIIKNTFFRFLHTEGIAVFFSLGL